MSEDDDFFNFVDLSKKRYVSDDTRDKMAFARTLTLSDVIKRFKLVHGNRYDYSKVNYVHSEQKVTIICSVHGEFFQSPMAHCKGQGCSKCAGAKIGKEKSDLIRVTLIEDFKSVHGDKYDYSKVIYVKQNVKVIVICPEHGEFLVIPMVHKRGKRGSHCPSCYKPSKIHKPKLTSAERKLWLVERQETNKQKFLDASRKRHGDKYDYSRVVYVGMNTDVEIICPVHGVFSQKPSHFVKTSKGCPKCAGEQRGLKVLKKGSLKKTPPPKTDK